jgi:hypothetical protein
MSAFETANLLAILAAGRRPVWAVQPDADQTIVPNTPSAGVSLSVGSGAPALYTEIVVRVREVPHARTSYYIVSTVDLVATYTFAVNGGTPISYDADAEGALSLTDILEGLKAAVEADGTTNGLVSAEVIAATSTEPAMLRIRDKTATDHYINTFDDSPGSAVVEVESDAVSCTATPWAYPRNTTALSTTSPNCWSRTTQAALSVTENNLAVRLETAGYERLYMQLGSVTGHASDDADVTPTVYVLIGPCGQE